MPRRGRSACGRSGDRLVIGYYVHHHGSGHLTRARLIAAALGQPVTGLSSLPRPFDWAGPWVSLPHDAVPAPDDRADVSAGGTLHWAPVGHAGYASRMAAIAEWVRQTSPALMVVDVSVEVTLLVRLLGVPVVVVAMRGDRSDRPHVTAYDAADALIALWPASLADTRWPRRWADKTCHTGGFSRLDELSRHEPRAEVHAGSVLVLWGRGGQAQGPDVGAAATASGPQWSWRRAAPDADAASLWQALTSAEVVVTHAGQNAVAEVAVSRRPAVVVAEARPFAEQVETAQVINGACIAVGLSQWPSAPDWTSVLERARDLGGERWSEWSDGCGVSRAVALLERLSAHS